jgi:PKHD-type hydroxylase
MVLLLKDALSSADAARLREALSDRSRATSDPKNPVASGRISGSALIDALRGHPLFLLGVQPNRISRPRFSCNGPATDETPNVDDASTGDDLMRADVAITVFLSDPENYDGGELVIDTGYGGEAYKERAGCCIAYPTSARHHVATVTRGQRWAADLCAQSLVRDQEQREILYNISCAERYLEVFHKGTPLDAERLRRCRELLFRFWSER